MKTLIKRLVWWRTDPKEYFIRVGYRKKSHYIIQLYIDLRIEASAGCHK
jgi:hypothetical protein